MSYERPQFHGEEQRPLVSGLWQYSSAQRNTKRSLWVSGQEKLMGREQAVVYDPISPRGHLRLNLSQLEIVRIKSG